MPPVKLDESATEILLNYRWPGNVRQLKNVTEQLSIIEQSRVITGDELRHYLPIYDGQKLPALYNSETVDQKTFSSEREILYKILFDMKKDMNELKRVVHSLMNKESVGPINYSDNTEVIKSFYPDESFIEPKQKQSDYNLDTKDDYDIQDTEEFVEESLSLVDKEIELIKKALDKHKGKRKAAATDLGISERTLYRKIKEYDLE
jgi:transcriptional regulator with PAS, ATPase and Fis domain